MKIVQVLTAMISSMSIPAIAWTTPSGSSVGDSPCNSRIWLTADGWQIECKGECNCIGAPYSCREMPYPTFKKCGCYAVVNGILQGKDRCSAVILIDLADGTETWACQGSLDDSCGCPPNFSTCKPIPGVNEGQVLVAPTEACHCG